MLSAFFVVAGAVQPAKILTFGDSLTAGLISGTTTEYVPYGIALSAALRDEVGATPTVLARGIVLESSHAMPARLESVLLQDGPFDCVLVLGGSNDLWRGDAEKIWSSLQLCHASVRAAGATLGLVTLPPFEPPVMRWLAWTGVLELTDATRLKVCLLYTSPSPRDS